MNLGVQENNPPPDLIMQAFQLGMPLMIVHPAPARRRSFDYPPPSIFIGNKRKIQF